jgi:ribosomal protein S18 acetylase RimI-like enzyme
MRNLREIVDKIFDKNLDDYSVINTKDSRKVDCREIRILIEENYLQSCSTEELILPKLNYSKILIEDEHNREIFELVICYINNTLYIHKIWIYNEYRRSGISEKVICRVSEEFKSKGFSDVVSIPVTRAGKRLLKSCGFTRVLRRSGKDILTYSRTK